MDKFPELTIGDYVLATKYKDGDPCDDFCVGFLSGYDATKKRYLVVDHHGKNFRGNGFRRAEKISPEEGRKIVELMPSIENTPGLSVWSHLKKIREC